MRSIEYLVSLYPDKTGREIIEIQKDDIRQDELEVQERLKDNISFAKDININGGYFKGSFGLNQYYYYNVTKVEVENSGRVTGNVEVILMFDFENVNPSRREFSIEKRQDTYKDLGNYDFSTLERATKEDFDKVDLYFKKAVDIFWDRIKLDNQ